MQNAEQKTALIAMSGGVDSSIAAYLMRQADFRCMGTTMRLYRNEDLGACNFRTCCSEKDIEDASEVAFQLDIPYEVLDFTLDFQEKIIGKFVRTYEAGGTPNPCIDCNRFMKFDKLLDFAEQHGLYYVVTGHYARIEQDEQTGRWLLKKGVDAGKDQSYMLYGMTQRELAHTLFPLGALTKAEVRALALENGFGNARKRDSQDICFVPDGDYAAFVERHTGCPCPPGDILDEAGRVVGRHRGYIRYTVGQRRGLGIAAPQPLYVRGVCPARNTVTVAGAGALYTDTVDARELNWIACDALGERPVRLLAKLRYRQPARRATAWQTGPDTLRVRFDEPQRAPAPGQALVLYDGGTVVGGGVLFSTV